MSIRKEKKEYQPVVEKDFFYIVCPCGCGRELPIEFTCESSDIPEFGNNIWRALAGEKGQEGAIQYLHEEVDNLDLG